MLYRKSLRRRFLLVLIAGSALFSGVAAGVAYRLGFDRAIQQGRATLEGMLTAVERTAAIGAYTGDSVLLQEIVEGLSTSPITDAVEVTNLAGHVLSKHGVIDDTLMAADSEKVNVIRRLNSPFDASEPVGRIRIFANMQQLHDAAQVEAKTLALLMIGQSLVVAFLLYLVVSHLFSRPIVRLANDLRRMQPGTASRLERPHQHQRDELGALIDGANALLQVNEVAFQRERELRVEIEKMEIQYRKIFDSSSAGIFVLNSDSHLINCNPTALKLAGLPGTDIQLFKGLNMLMLIFVRPERVRALIDQALQSGDTVAADLELRPHGKRKLNRLSDQQRWVHCLISVQLAAGESVAGGPAKPHLIEGVMYDITDRKIAESEVRRQAEHDSLTGLKNRAASNAMLDRLVTDARETGQTLSVLCVDLDGFKAVNDAHGHKAGDQVLIECAQRMRTVVRRSTDLLARVGGDEFLVVLDSIDSETDNLNQIAQGLVDVLRAPFELEQYFTARIGASVGIACFPRDGETKESLLHAADAAMYEVKRTGKNQFAFAFNAVE